MVTSLDAVKWHGGEVLELYRKRGKASLLLSLYAYQLMHSLRMLMQYITFQGWSLRKVREQILKTAATVVVHARRLTMHIGHSDDKWWPTLLRHLPLLHPVPV